jgi:hypothetical protein
MDTDEFFAVIRNLDFWERLMNVKFVEANVKGDVTTVKVIHVATPSFFIYDLDGEIKLMVEITSDIRIGYIDLEEIAEFDGKLLEKLKDQVMLENNGMDSNDRYFPKSNESMELFNSLIKTAKWKKQPME